MDHKVTLESILDNFGMFRRYHRRFMIIAMYMYASSAVVSTTYIFVAEETNYRCAQDLFRNNTCGSVDGSRCTEWIYDDPHSFVAEFDLACKEWKRTLIGSVSMFGYMLGLFVIDPLSDKIGRKKTILSTAVAGAAIGFGKSFSQTYWSYVIFGCLVTMIGDWYSPLYMLNLEIVSAKNRVMFQFICGLGYTFGSILTAAVAWAFPYWRHFVMVTYAPAFLVVLANCFIDESPRWLLSKKKNKEAAAVIENMADRNKIPLDDNLSNRIKLEDDDIKSIAFLDVLKLTFRSQTLLKRFLVCVIWWMTSTFVNYGTLINSVSLQGNKYVNYALMSVVDVPGDLIIMYILNRYKRRLPLMCSFFVASLLFFIHPILPQDVGWLSVAVYMASKMMSSFYFNITYIYTSELFPTYTRNSMHALCSALGRIGAMIAPQTPLLMVYWSELPMLLFGVSSLVAGVLTLLVPDTARAALPDTVTQAERIGRRQRDKQNKTGLDNLAVTSD